MAREIKVGLLAGLAFIICFAILLANRGRQDPPIASKDAPQARPYMTDGGANVPGAVQQSASHLRANPTNTERRFLDGHIAQQASIPTEAAMARVVGATVIHPATSGADLPLPESGTGGTIPTAGNVVEGSARAGHQPAERALTSRSEDELLPRQELERRLGIPSTEPTLTSLPIPQPGLSPQSAQTTRTVTYTVSPGDTLSKIAQAHFGDKSRTSVNAIFDTNRSVISNPDELQAGMVLTLPFVEGTARVIQSERPVANTPTASKAEEARTRPIRKSAEPPPQTYRWYQIKKNDRYASIAREQLGDTGRWRELYELNKDKFPNPQSIREGVRIKLPEAKVLAAAEGRR